MENGLGSDFVSTLCRGPDGSIWVRTLGGLNRYKQGKLTLYRDKDGLLRLSGKTLTQYTTQGGLISNSVYALFEDSEGPLWVATRRGLNRIRGNQFTTVTTQDGLPVAHCHRPDFHRLFFGKTLA